MQPRSSDIQIFHERRQFNMDGAVLPAGPARQENLKRLHLESEDFGALEDSVISSGSPLIKMRRDSYSEHPPAFSPSEGLWSGHHFSIEHGPVESSSTPQAFLQSTQAVTMGNQSNASPATQSNWGISQLSGSCTPTPGFEQMVSFTSDGSCHYGQQALRSNPQQSYENVISTSSQGFSHNSGFPGSPQSSRGGWASASPPEGMPRTMSQNPNPSSPGLASSTQVLRRDGVRKKNARFEIPAERNLRTIDQLINQTNDEQEIKELKQQKRLLRNRQAALDSRQRKKQHTERLEEEKKHYTALISELEEALGEMKLQEAEWQREKESYALSQQQYERYIEELVRDHTIETGELRKKNAILMEQLQRLEGTAMSTAPSSNGFSGDFSEYDQLGMNSGWPDDFSMEHQFSIEVEPRTGTSINNTGKKDMTQEPPSGTHADESAVSSGFLLMLLLCGAWVASRTSAGSSSILPTIPEELRNASATVLDNIYKDSGIHIQGSASLGQTRSTGQENARIASPKANFATYDMNSIPRTSLESLHHRLTTPSERQLREQEFSLTPTQYNDISSTSSYPTGCVQDVGGGKTIEDILADTQVPGERVAETYTRSLMKDRVSTQVLQDFAQMVAQGNLISQNRWKMEPVD